MSSKDKKADFQFANSNRAVHVIQLPELPELPELNQDSMEAALLKFDLHPLHQAKTRLQVCVGEIELSVGELVNAKENQVLCLDRTIDQVVDLLIEGQVIARGQLVAVDNHFAIRITELPLPLQLIGVKE